MATKKATECNPTEHDFHSVGSNIISANINFYNENVSVMKNAEVLLFCARCGKLKYVEAKIQRVTLT